MLRQKPIRASLLTLLCCLALATICSAQATPGANANSAPERRADLISVVAAKLRLVRSIDSSLVRAEPPVYRVFMICLPTARRTHQRPGALEIMLRSRETRNQKRLRRAAIVPRYGHMLRLRTRPRISLQ